MIFLAVDDERFALADLVEALHEAAPESEIHPFTAPSRALAYAGDQPVEAAFLDIELGTMSGLVLAKQLKDLRPEIHIVFVTSHEQYAVGAFQLHATGYLMKPVTAADIRRELTFLYGEQSAPRRVQVQTFGGFEVYVDGEPLSFGRAKAKELLAYLVDRRGTGVTTREACAVLWEDAPYDTARKNYFQTIVADLRASLRAARAEDILHRSRNSLAVVPALLDCDSYRFLEGDPAAINSYRRDYLPGYSWAEFSIASLERGY